MAEGLAYCLRFTNDLPIPADTSATSVVGQAVDFCLNGLRGPDGVLLTAAVGGEMTGVVNWLIADNVTAVNFYTTLNPVPMLFVSLPANSSSDWRVIPGFMGFVKDEPQTVNSGQITLDARQEIDEVFRLRFAETQKLSREMRDILKRALAGGSNLDAALLSISSDLPNNNRLASFF